MVASAQSLMASACLVDGNLGQLSRLEQRLVFGNGPFYGAVYFNPCSIELPERSATDAAHHHRIHGLPAQCHKRLAFAMQVIEIPIADAFYFPGFRINDNKGSGGSKMSEYCTIDTRILLGWKSDFHTLSPVFSPQLPPPRPSQRAEL
jgi:hypothetical protein